VEKTGEKLGENQGIYSRKQELPMMMMMMMCLREWEP